jgi:hypothetical protein
MTKSTDDFARRLDAVVPADEWGVHWASDPHAAGDLLHKLIGTASGGPVWMFRGNESLEFVDFAHLGRGRCTHELGSFTVKVLATGRGLNDARAWDFVYVTTSNQQLSSFLLCAQFSPYNVNGTAQRVLREMLDKIEGGEFSLEEATDRGLTKFGLHPADA